MTAPTMRERVARAIADANMEDFDELPELHLAMADAAIKAMREPTRSVAIAHQVGFCREWTDPWDCLGPEQEEVLGLHVAGEDMFDAAHERLDEYMLTAWQGAIDAALAEKPDGD